MRFLIFAFMLVSFGSNSNDLEGCELAGDQAKKIMQFRQSKNNLKLVISLFSESEILIVVDAFLEDHVDVIGQLNIQIDAFGYSSYDDESRRYDEMESKRDNIINKFKVKYFVQCLKNKAS